MGKSELLMRVSSGKLGTGGLGLLKLASQRGASSTNRSNFSGSSLFLGEC